VIDLIAVLNSYIFFLTIVEADSALNTR
jgi:hypothetical protein